MDGGGRLARSLRSLRPQADLKAAAIGAVVLLRERLGAHRPSSVKRSLQFERPHRLIALLERYLPYRAGVVATALILLGSASLGVVKGGHLEEFISALSDTRNAIANSAGFRITSIAISGRKQLSQDEVLAIGGGNGRPAPLVLAAPPAPAKLKANPWIGETTGRKLHPRPPPIHTVQPAPLPPW